MVIAKNIKKTLINTTCLFERMNMQNNQCLSTKDGNCAHLLNYCLTFISQNQADILASVAWIRWG